MSKQHQAPSWCWMLLWHMVDAVMVASFHSVLLRGAVNRQTNVRESDVCRWRQCHHRATAKSFFSRDAHRNDNSKSHFVLLYIIASQNQSWWQTLLSTLISPWLLLCVGWLPVVMHFIPTFDQINVPLSFDLSVSAYHHHLLTTTTTAKIQ